MLYVSLFRVDQITLENSHNQSSYATRFVNVASWKIGFFVGKIGYFMSYYKC